MIIGISLLMVGAGLWSCRVEGLAAPMPVSPAATWVRTAAGWERSDWRLAVPAERRIVHPLVVTAGQGLVSVLALVALERETGSRRRA